MEALKSVSENRGILSAGRAAASSSTRTAVAPGYGFENLERKRPANKPLRRGRGAFLSNSSRTTVEASGRDLGRQGTKAVDFST